MKIKSRFIIAVVVALLLGFSQLADAQQPGKAPRIGYISGTNESGSGSPLAGLRQGLRDHGYTKGENVAAGYIDKILKGAKPADLPTGKSASWPEPKK